MNALRRRWVLLAILVAMPATVASAVDAPAGAAPVVAAAPAVAGARPAHASSTAATAAADTKPAPGTDATPGNAPATDAAQATRISAAVHIVMNTTLSQAQRIGALAEVKKAAQDGNGWAQFVVGSLYMWGPEHPANLLPRDLGKAQTYLSNAAVHGWLEAMAAMAEINLMTGDAKAALVWALTDYYFSGAEHYTRKGYLADLIHRCDKQLSKADRNTALADANAFIARYQAGIRVAHAEALSHSVSASCRLRELSPHKRRLPDTTIGSIMWSGDLPSSGNAMNLVGVDAQGQVRRVIAINSFPSWRIAWITRELAFDTRFNAAPDCSKKLRWGALPFDYGSGEYEFNRN